MRIQRCCFWSWPLLLVPMAWGALAVEGPSSLGSQAPVARADTAQVFFIDDIPLPAQEMGVLLRLHAKEGQTIAEGELLAEIDDRKPQLAKLAAELERAAAMARAEDDIDVEFAIASHEVALSQLQKDLSVNERQPGAVPESEIQIKRLAEHRARLQIDKSKLDQRVAQLTADVHSAAVKSAEETIRRCQIRAPFTGTVIDVLKHEGEWVNTGEPVLRLVRMDRLRVDGLLDASLYDAHEVEGRPVTVTVHLARGKTVDFSGHVVFVNLQVQAGNKYRVRAEVDNRREQAGWVLRPGLPVTMTVHLR